MAKRAEGQEAEGRVVAVEEVPPAPPEEPVAGRTLIVKTRNEGSLRITIPADARVTFGAFVPPGKNGASFGITTALRIYHGANKDHQIAVFQDVVSFYDSSLSIQKLVKQKESQASVKHEKGKVVAAERLEQADEWVDL